MLNLEQQKAYLELIDQNMEELKERMHCLRKRMVIMETQNLNTKAQAELLETMEEVIHSVEETRKEAVRVFTTGEIRAYPRGGEDRRKTPGRR